MNTPPTTPKTLERKRLTNEADGGTYAPGIGTFFNENRKKLIEEYVRKGLEQFVQQQKGST